MKITLYELLGLVKEGKAPKKFKMSELTYILNENNGLYYDDFENELLDNINLFHCLDERIEIIEDKKIEKMFYYSNEEELYNHSKVLLFNTFVDKINEIIDKVNSMEDK